MEQHTGQVLLEKLRKGKMCKFSACPYNFNIFVCLAYVSPACNSTTVMCDVVEVVTQNSVK